MWYLTIFQLHQNRLGSNKKLHFQRSSLELYRHACHVCPCDIARRPQYTKMRSSVLRSHSTTFEDVILSAATATATATATPIHWMIHFPLSIRHDNSQEVTAAATPFHLTNSKHHAKSERMKKFLILLVVYPSVFVYFSQHLSFCLLENVSAAKQTPIIRISSRRIFDEYIFFETYRPRIHRKTIYLNRNRRCSTAARD